MTNTPSLFFILHTGSLIMKLSEQLNEAILHYQQGVATAAEKKLVEDLYNSFEQENTVVDAGITGDRNNLEKESLALIQTRIAQQRTIAPAPVVTMRMLKKLGIAAAVLIIITAGIYRWLKPSPIQPAPPIAKTDVAPGGNKAVLTLSDGRQIVLHDMANGTVTSQDGVQILKPDSGRLVYSTTSAAGNTVAYNTLATPRGGQYQLSLPDGTKVWLNAGSSIRYPVTFNGAERNVAITGEAYFEVAKNPRQAFIVKTENAAIRVLGTHFNIMAYKEEKNSQTTLLEGALRVEGPVQQVLLKPGQQGMLANTSGELTVREVDTQEAVAWMHGQLSMKYIDVAAFMRQISRWYDVDVVFEGEVPAMSFSGSINKKINLSLVLKALNDNGLHISLVNGKLIVKK